MRLAKGLLMGSLLWAATLGTGATAQAAAVNVLLTPMDGQVVMNIRVRRSLWQRMRSRGGRFMVRVWLRGQNGWQQRRLFQMTRRKFVRNIPMSRFCSGTEYGRKRFAVQVGHIRDGLWFNRFTRSPQTNFIALHQDVTTLRCGRMPQDLPPGSPPAGANTSADMGQPPPPTQPPPTQPPPSFPPPTHSDTANDPTPPPPAQPPAPPQQIVVPESTSRGFASALKRQSSDSTRLRMLGNWLSGLRSRNELVSGRAVRRFIRVFSFDSNKINAARLLSRYVARPLRAAQVGAILSAFSFDSSKSKVVGYFCRGLADPGNTYIIAREFSFSGGKSYVMRTCR
ncbi:MAG: DUF4476 domain-containing protein [Myxococcales bacterium]|nr:DUF4476 domain-containing protein [Myxococcales bacterium]